MASLLEQIMEKRGFDEAYLKPDYDKLDSFGKLPDVAPAIKRLEKAIKDGEKILIYGDYDADGVTASTVMYDALTLAGAKEPEIMLPDRFKDGYGMSQRLVDHAKEEKIPLVITVDCGSNNAEIIAKLKENGTDTIVTDHHECLGDLPDAVAVINPHRPDKKVKKELKDLAGVGVAFMFARELVKKGLIPEGQEKWLLDLVLIGTLCDSMVLAGANRPLCFWGMRVLEKTRRPGLKELLHKSGVKKLTSEAIGFQLGPRINSAGRMQSATVALDLLMTKSRAEAATLAETLEGLNVARKSEQNRAVREIRQRGISDSPVLVGVGRWHEGVLGIIAGRLTEEYHRPAFVLAEVEPGILKGSGRSFGDFNLALALSECQSLLIGGGGHAGACGLSLKKENLIAFRTKINEYYQSLNLKDQEKYLELSPDLTFSDFSNLTTDEVTELSQLEPFGEGNPEPVVALKGVNVLAIRRMGSEEQHLKLTLQDESGKTFQAIAFFAPQEWLNLQPNQKVDATLHLLLNEWQGITTAEGRLLTLSPA